jgi:flagellar biosynthesis protein FlhG
MWRAVRARRPLLIEKPDAVAARAFANVADSLLALDLAAQSGVGA